MGIFLQSCLIFQRIVVKRRENVGRTLSTRQITRACVGVLCMCVCEAIEPVLVTVAAARYRRALCTQSVRPCRYPPYRPVSDNETDDSGSLLEETDEPDNVRLHLYPGTDDPVLRALGRSVQPPLQMSVQQMSVQPPPQMSVQPPPQMSVQPPLQMSVQPPLQMQKKNNRCFKIVSLSASFGCESCA